MGDHEDGGKIIEFPLDRTRPGSFKPRACEEPFTVTFDGEAGGFVEDYASIHEIGRGETVRRGMSYLALEASLGPNEVIGIIDKKKGTVDEVDSGWERVPSSYQTRSKRLSGLFGWFRR